MCQCLQTSCWRDNTPRWLPVFTSLSSLQSFSPVPEPVEGVGIHHSVPRTVWIYSGQRKSTGGLKSFGSNGATHFVPSMPPPVRSLNSPCALSSNYGLVNRSINV